MSFYRREILQQAFSIIWHKKYLWFLGFFAGLVAHGGEPDLLFRQGNSLNWLKDNLAALRDVMQSGDGGRFLSAIRQVAADYPLNTLAYIVLTLLLLVVIIWLVIVAQAALVLIVGRTMQRKPAALFDGLADGATKFWPMVILNLITKLISWGLWIILGALPAIIYLITGVASWAIIAVAGSLLVTLPISMVISFITKYAANYIVLQNADPIQAIRQAWLLFRRNWLVTAEVAALVFLINFAIAIVVVAVAIYLIQAVTGWSEFYALVGALVIVHAFVSTFSFATWTITFLKLLEGRGVSALGQLSTRLFNLAPSKNP